MGRYSHAGSFKSWCSRCPQDPEYPAERINFILQDCEVHSLITKHRLAGKHPEFSCPALVIEQELRNAENESNAKINIEEIGLSDEHICYVIYTSGSTGKPKGVAIKHQSVCNYLQQAKKIYKLQSSDRVYQGFSVTFDASIEEIWTTLTSGATLITTNDKALRSGAGLVDFLHQHEVSFFSTIPTLLTMLEPPFPALRLLVLGGETCHTDLVDRWSHPNLRIINTYGPTEATVITTYSECQPGKPVTIGQPLPGCEVFILNSELQPARVNEEGEICIGGICLTDGYINRPDLSQTKFIDHPKLNKRLYKTGDLARKLENGDIQFIGRADNQVKLRGFRIELDEIEAVLHEYFGIRQAVVTVHRPPEGVESLVAYLLTNDTKTFNLKKLTQFLRSRSGALHGSKHIRNRRSIPIITKRQNRPKKFTTAKN